MSPYFDGGMKPWQLQAIRLFVHLGLNRARLLFNPSPSLPSFPSVKSPCCSAFVSIGVHSWFSSPSLPSFPSVESPSVPHPCPSVLIRGLWRQPHPIKPPGRI